MSVTVAFFALFGFIFLVTQFFQFVARLRRRCRPACASCPSPAASRSGAVTGPVLVSRLARGSSS